MDKENACKEDFPDQFCYFCGKLCYAKDHSKNFPLEHYPIYYSGELVMCRACSENEALHAKFYKLKGVK